MNVPFTVYDPSTGEILRSGQCKPEDVARQALAGEAVLAGFRGNDIKDRVTVVAGKAKVAKRDATDIEARTPKMPEVVDRFEVLLAALKKKGVAVSRADLDSAAVDVAATKAAAGGGKKGV